MQPILYKVIYCVLKYCWLIKVKQNFNKTNFNHYSYEAHYPIKLYQDKTAVKEVYFNWRGIKLFPCSCMIIKNAPFPSAAYRSALCLQILHYFALLLLEKDCDVVFSLSKVKISPSSSISTALYG